MGCGASAPVMEASLEVAKRADGDVTAPLEESTITADGDVKNPKEGYVDTLDEPGRKAEYASVADLVVTKEDVALEHKQVETVDAVTGQATPGDGTVENTTPGPGIVSIPDESAGNTTVYYNEQEDRLQWGIHSFSADELRAFLKTLKPLPQLPAKFLPSVREDATLFSNAYEGLRKSHGAPEALEEVAQECAAIRRQIIEQQDDDEPNVNSSFDRGEGEEEHVENFWNEPFFLLVSAAKIYSKFSEWIASISAKTGPSSTHSVGFKHIQSAAQKAQRPVWRHTSSEGEDGSCEPVTRGWGSLLDVVRGSVVCEDWQAVLRCLQAVRGDFDVEILRLRNRFTDSSDVPQVWGGYRHISLAVRLLGHGHVCELLVHHRSLQTLRSSESERRYHDFRDSLAWSQDGKEGVETYTQLLSPCTPQRTRE